MWDIPILFLIYLVLKYYFCKASTENTSSAAEKETETVLREYSIDNEVDPEKVISHLIQNNVIDQKYKENIKQKFKDLRRQGAETLIDILSKSERLDFTELITALQKAGYQELAQKLTEDFEKKKEMRANMKPTVNKEKTHASDVEDVMNLIYKTMEDNGNKVYSQKAFARVEKEIREEERRKWILKEELVKKLREEKAEMERKRRKEIEEEYEKRRANVREDIKKDVESNDVGLLGKLSEGVKKSHF